MTASSVVGRCERSVGDVYRAWWWPRPGAVRDLDPGGVVGSHGSERPATARRSAGTRGCGPTWCRDRVTVGEQQVEPGLAAHAAATSGTMSAMASAGGTPGLSRSRTSAHTSAESVGRVQGEQVGGRQQAGQRATEPGQPVTAPLWLNSQRPAANGAAAACRVGMPAGGVADGGQQRAGAHHPGQVGEATRRPRSARPAGSRAGLRIAVGVPADAEPVRVHRPVPLAARRPGLAEQAVRRVDQQLAERSRGGPR